jgi:hypothetical protein
MTSEDRRRSADAYLDLILNALRLHTHWRARDVLDPWFAFETGNDPSSGAKFLTSGSRPHTFDNPCPWQHWRTFRHPHFWVTPAAEEVLARAEARDRGVQKKHRDPDDLSLRLITDHSVPLARIVKELEDEALWERDALREFLLHHYRRGLLTKIEDNRLNATVVDGVCLKDAMPPRWERGSDPFARYRAMIPPLSNVVHH